MRVLHCAAVVVLLVVAAVTVAAQAPYTSWTEVNPRAFTPRASAVSAYFPDSGNGTWIVLNGLTHNSTGEETVLPDAQKSTDVGMTWSPLPLPPFIRCEMAADVVQLNFSSPKLTLLVSGGVDFISYESFNDVWRSDDKGQTFQLVTAAAPWPIRHAHGMVTMARHFPQLLVILGGYRFADTHGYFLNDVWTTHSAGVSWSQMPLAPWSGRGDAGIVVSASGNLYVVGGYGMLPDGAQGLLNDAWMASGDGLFTWSLMCSAAAWAPRWGMTLESFNNTLVMVAGDDGGANRVVIDPYYAKINEVWLSWDGGMNWTVMGNATFGGRSDCVSEIIGSSLYLLGGEDDQHTISHVDAQVWMTPVVAVAPMPPTPVPVAPVVIASSSSGSAGPVPDDGPSSGGLSTGAIVAIVIAILIVLGAAGWFFFIRKPSQPKATTEGGNEYHLQV